MKKQSLVNSRARLRTPSFRPRGMHTLQQWRTHIRGHLLFLATTPRADELDFARARVDLPLLDLPELLLAHGLHLVCLRYLQKRTCTPAGTCACWVRDRIQLRMARCSPSSAIGGYTRQSWRAAKDGTSRSWHESGPKRGPLVHQTSGCPFAIPWTNETLPEACQTEETSVLFTSTQPNAYPSQPWPSRETQAQNGPSLWVVCGILPSNQSATILLSANYIAPGAILGRLEKNGLLKLPVLEGRLLQLL